MTGLSISDKDQAMFASLHRHHLRHPGSVSARVVKLLRREEVTIGNLATARLEWLKLGLDKAPIAPRGNARLGGNT